MTIEGERVFRITEAKEEHGYARCAIEGMAAAFHCELYIPNPDDDDLMRLQRGDLIAGSLRGKTVTGIRILKKASPPPELISSLASLVAALASQGVSFPHSVERLADHDWRFNFRQPARAEGTLKGLVLARLEFLFDWQRHHPLDDRSLVLRTAAAMARHGVALKLAERLDEAEDLQGFQVLPNGPSIRCGEEGNWEQPAGLYIPLVAFLNEALARHDAKVRWIRTAEDFVLLDPGLAELLFAHQILEQG